MHPEESELPNTPLAKPLGVLHPSFSLDQFEHHRQLPSPALTQRGRALLACAMGSTRFMRQLQGQDQVFGVKFKASGFYPF